MKNSHKMPEMGDTAIAEQKQAEEALRAERDFNAALVEASPAFLVTINGDGRIRSMNRAMLQALGYTLEEVAGKDYLTTVVSETERPMLAGVFARLTELREPTLNENHVQTRDGRLILVEWHGRPILKPTGEFDYFFGFGLDITERKLAEDRLQSMVENAPEAIVVIDLTTGLFIESNENAVKLYGLSREELVKVGPADMSPPVQPDGRLSTEKALEKINAAMQGETPVFEWVHRNARGEDIPCEIRLVRLPGNLPLVRTSITDITERKRMEDILRQRDELLQKQTVIFASLAHSEAIYGGDLEAALKEITEAAAYTLNVRRASVWLYDETRTRIRCVDLFEQGTGHSKGVELSATDFPGYFKALESEKIIAAHNAHTDPSTQEFSQSYLTPLGINSMLDAPIRLRGRAVGVICHEHVGPVRQWLLEEQVFAGNITDFVSTALESQQRLQVEAMVEESRARFQGLVETLSDWIWEIGQNGTYTYVSPQVKNLLGYEPEEVLGKTPFDLMPPEEARRIAGVFGPLLSTQQPLVALENTNRHKDGHLVVFETSGMPFFDAAGEFKGYRGIDRDITKRQLAEARLRTMIENAPEAIIVIDLTTGLFTEFNENAVKLYGLSREELVKVGPAGVSPPVQPDGRLSTEKALEQINAAMQGEVPVFEWIHRNAHGEDVPCEIRLVRLPGDLPLVRASITDITNRKRAEQALRESEEKFKTLADNLVVGVFVHQDGIIKYSGREAARLLGYSDPAEVIGRSMIDMVHPDERPRIADLARRRVAGESVPDSYETRLLRKDGTGMDVDLYSSLVNYEGRPATQGAFLDITARKQAEEAVRTSQRQLADIVTSLPDAALAIDKEKHIIIWNRAIEEMTGVPTAEMMGKGDYVYSIPFYGVARPALMDLVFMDQAELAARYPHIARDGDTLTAEVFCNALYDNKGAWVFAKASPLHDQFGNIIGAIEIIRDITESKRLEQERERLTSILESTTDLVAISDMEARVIYMNHAGRRMVGVGDDEDLSTTRIPDYTPPWALETVLNQGVPTAIQEGSWSGEGAMLARDGHEVSVSQVIMVHRAADGTPQNISTIARDITESKRAEVELNRQVSILNNSQDFIAAVDMQGLQIYVNLAGARMLGYDNPRELIGRRIKDMHSPADTLRVEQEGIPTAMREGIWRGENRLLRLDGTLIPVDQSIFVIRDAEGQPQAIATIMADITERKQAEEAVRDSAYRQEQILKGLVAQLIALLSPDGTVLNLNDTALAASGQPASEMLGILFWDGWWWQISEATRQRLMGAVAEAAQGTFVRYETDVQTVGGVITIDFSLNPIKSEAGQVLFIVAEGRDITERKRAEAQVERNLREINVRYEISQALAGAQTENDALDALVQHAGFYPQARVTLYTFERQGDDVAIILRRDNVFESGLVSATPVGTRFPASRFPLINLFSQDRTFVSSDFFADERVDPAARQLAQQIGSASLAAFPLTVGSEWMGFVIAMAEPAGYFDETKQHLYRTLAEQGAVALQTARLRDQIQDAMTRRGYQVQISTEISQEVASASELSDLFSRVVTLTKERLGYYHTQLLHYDPMQDAVVLINGYGETGQKMLAGGHKLPMGSGLIGTAAASGETILRSTLAEDPDWQPNPLLPDTQGEIAVPIKFQDKVLGVLDAQSNQAGALTEDDRLLLEGLCGQVAVAIEQTRLRQEMAERLEEVNRLYRSMSREGWKTYRETADLPTGFMFDQTGIGPVDEGGLADELFANIPMKVLGGEVVGTLTVANDPRHPTSPEDQAFLQQVSDQIALALESARLSAQTQSALEQTEKLFEAGGHIAQAADLQELVSTVVQTLNIPEVNRAIMVTFNFGPTGDLAGMDVIANWWNGSGHEATAVGTHYPIEAVGFMSLFLSPTPVFFNDVFNDERVDSVELMKNLNLRAMASLPLYSGAQQIGALIVESEMPRQFTQDETRLYTALAPQISTVLENRRQFERAQSALAQTEKLAEASLRFARSADLQELLQIAVEALDIAVINRAVMGILEYDSANNLDGMILVANWWSGHGQKPTPIGARYPSQVIKVLPLLLSSVPVFFDDVFTDDRLDEMGVAFLKQTNIRAITILPLYTGARQVGAILLQSEEVHRFTQNEIGLFTAMGPQIATVLENRRQFERAKQQAERESTLNLISQKIQSATTVEAVLQIAARELGHALGAPMTIAQLSMKDKK